MSNGNVTRGSFDDDDRSDDEEDDDHVGHMEVDGDRFVVQHPLPDRSGYRGSIQPRSTEVDKEGRSRRRDGHHRGDHGRHASSSSLKRHDEIRSPPRR